MKISRTVLSVTAAGAALLALSACTVPDAPAVGASGASSTSAAPVAAVAPGTTVDAERLSAGAAQDAARAALAKCKADGFGFVSVAVTDRSGQLQAFVRGDNAAAHTIEAARQKAYTSAAFGAPTSDLAERATGEGAGLKDLPDTLFLGGAVPVKSGEASIGGIGVGGSPSGAQDETCAAAGLAALTK